MFSLLSQYSALIIIIFLRKNNAVQIVICVRGNGAINVVIATGYLVYASGASYNIN